MPNWRGLDRGGARVQAAWGWAFANVTRSAIHIEPR